MYFCFFLTTESLQNAISCLSPPPFSASALPRTDPSLGGVGEDVPRRGTGGGYQVHESPPIPYGPGGPPARSAVGGKGGRKQSGEHFDKGPVTTENLPHITFSFFAAQHDGNGSKVPNTVAES